MLNLDTKTIWNKQGIFFFFLITFITPNVWSLEEKTTMKHGVVFYEEGRFGGWPANNGIWSWDNEIVVGFTLGYYKRNPRGGHPIDGDRIQTKRQARTLDGGETWTIEVPTYLQPNEEEKPASQLQNRIDFSHPHLAMRFRNNRFYYSYDRCKTWHGPFLLHDFGRKGLLARTDYIINSKDDLMAFLATEKDGGGEGWPCCIRTQDGGLTWQLVGWIGEQPGEGGYSIMPSTLRLNQNSLLSIIRRRGVLEGKKRWWIEGYLSADNGSNWYLLAQPTINNHGNPPHMIHLQDGRIALTYGFRGKPYGIRAMFSHDDGKTWSDERILRSDGGGWDLGYPRTVQRPDGKCVTIYYYNTSKRPERFIAYTIWNP